MKLQLADWLLSDAHRPLKAACALGLACVLALAALAQGRTRCVSLSDALDHPALCDGRRVAMGLVQISAVEDGVPLVRAAGKDYRLPMPPQGVAPGQYVSASGVFAQPDGFQADFVHPHAPRGYKVGLSLAAALGVVGYACRAFWPRVRPPRG